MTTMAIGRSTPSPPDPNRLIPKLPTTSPAAPKEGTAP